LRGERGARTRPSTLDRRPSTVDPRPSTVDPRHSTPDTRRPAHSSLTHSLTRPRSSRRPSCRRTRPRRWCVFGSARRARTPPSDSRWLARPPDRPLARSRWSSRTPALVPRTRRRCMRPVDRPASSSSAFGWTTSRVRRRRRRRCPRPRGRRADNPTNETRHCGESPPTGCPSSNASTSRRPYVLPVIMTTAATLDSPADSPTHSLSTLARQTGPAGGLQERPASGRRVPP